MGEPGREADSEGATCQPCGGSLVPSGPIRSHPQLVSSGQDHSALSLEESLSPVLSWNLLLFSEFLYTATTAGAPKSVCLSIREFTPMNQVPGMFREGRSGGLVCPKAGVSSKRLC